jgi:hypothetical protein
MKNSSFYFKWWPFILGFLFGIFGVLFSVFSAEDRRDKIYSALFGLAINMVLTFILLKNGLVEFPVMK